jgi:ornithine cyclodeaminase/alanine dehydrogenase-like protein (mu-crystallin family)
MKYLGEEVVKKALSYKALVDRLRLGFGEGKVITPTRSHFDFEGASGERDSTLLLMPSWLPGKNVGVKIVTVSPANANLNLPSIHGVYVFFDAQTGECQYIFDARAVTVKRTAATSALASSYLSREDSRILLMMGTGALSAELIKAHASVRPIEKVLVWGRDVEKAKAVCKTLNSENFTSEPVTNLKEACGKADIISCATLSKTPLLSGEFIKEGQHIDLVGAYRPDMREADDGVIQRARIFVDHYAGALKECGELLIPLNEKIIERSDVIAELSELCSLKKTGRNTKTEITLFKSVGHAMEDLIAAQIIAESVANENKE